MKEFTPEPMNAYGIAISWLEMHNVRRVDHGAFAYFWVMMKEDGKYHRVTKQEIYRSIVTMFDDRHGIGEYNNTPCSRAIVKEAEWLARHMGYIVQVQGPYEDGMELSEPL